MKLGITGHQKLSDPYWVKSEILRIIQAQPTPPVGVTSLAVGADQLFADAMLESGHSFEVIIPCASYADVFDSRGRADYERLLSSAATIAIMSSAGCDEPAYLAAGRRVVDESDIIIAVWNGRAAAGTGGTADVIGYATRQKKPYVHVNPETRATKWCG